MVHRQVAYLTGGPVSAAEDPAADDDAPAQSRAQWQERIGVSPTSGASDRFAESTSVGIVLDGDRHSSEAARHE